MRFVGKNYEKTGEKSHRSTMARLMLVKHKRKFATFDACLHCCWVFLVSNASFDMRFASFIAVFRVLSSPVHNTQIDLLVFIGCGYDDFPTNIFYPMTQLANYIALTEFGFSE